MTIYVWHDGGGAGYVVARCRINWRVISRSISEGVTGQVAPETRELPSGTLTVVGDGYTNPDQTLLAPDWGGITERQEYRFTQGENVNLTLPDPGGNPVPSISVVGGRIPAGLTITFNDTTPKGTPFEVRTITGASTQYGSIPLRLEATNSQGSKSIDITFTIAQAGSPQFTEAEGPDQVWVNGDSVSLLIPDPNGNPAPQYLLTGAPAGVSINTATRTLESNQISASGSGRLVVTAYNSRGTSTWAVRWRVESQQAPRWTVSSLAAQSWKTGQDVSLKVPNPGGRPTAKIVASGLPDGVVWNESTLTLEGIPTTASTGTITLTATVTVGAGALMATVGTATLTVPWTVILSDLPAWLETGGAMQWLGYNEVMPSVVVPLVDNHAKADLPTVTYTADGLPDGITFDATTRTIAGTPTTNKQRGTITITATNVNGSDTYTYDYAVGVFQAVSWARAGDAATSYWIQGELYEKFINRPDGEPFPDPVYTVTGVPAGVDWIPLRLDGRPVSIGTNQFVLTATNAFKGTTYTDTYTVTIEVVAPPISVFDEDGSINASGISNVALSGLTYDGEHLLALDVYNDEVYGIDPVSRTRFSDKDISAETIHEAFKAINPAEPDSIEPTAICWDGEAALILDGGTYSVIAIANGVPHPAKNIDGAEVRKVIEPSIGGIPQGIAADGRSVAISIAGAGIYWFTDGVFDGRSITQGRLIEQIQGEPFVTGLHYDGSGLLAVDARGRRVRRFRGDSTDAARTIGRSVFEEANQNILPSGVAADNRDDGTVWVVDRSNNRIYAFKYGDLGNFPRIEPPTYDAGVPRYPFVVNEEDDGNRVGVDAIFDLPVDRSLTGLVYANGTVYVLDNQNNWIWAFTRGARDASKDIILEQEGGYQGLAWDGVSLLVARGRNEVHAYTDGVYDASRSYLGRSLVSQIPGIGNANYAIRGITADPDTNTLWITGPRDTIAAFKNGAYDAEQSVTAAQLRKAGSSISPSGLTYDGKYLYVADETRAINALEQGEVASVLDYSSFDLIRVANQMALDPSELRYVNDDELPALGLPRMNVTGIAWDGNNMLVLDTNTNQIYSLSRRVSPPPVSGIISYYATGLPRGVFLDPETLEVAGKPTHVERGKAVIIALNLTGRDEYTFDWSTVQEILQNIEYTAVGLPRGVTFDPATLTFSGIPREAGTGVIVVTASNGIAEDTYRIPWSTVEGRKAGVDQYERIPMTLRVHWPDAGTEIIDGTITAAKKTFGLHDTYYNRGPGIVRSSCVVDFVEENRPKYKTLGQVPITDRLLELAPNTPVTVDVLDQHGVIWWTGIVSDEFSIDRTTVKAVRLTIEYSLSVLNRSEPPNDLIFLDKPIWGSTGTWRDSVLYQLLAEQYGLAVQPSQYSESIPVEPPRHTVIPINGPDRGNVVWDALRDLCLKYGLVIYPTYDGTSYIVERIAGRARIVDHTQDLPEPPWTTTRQQSAVRSLQARYAATESFIARTTQQSGTVWRAPEGFILPAGESWPAGATESNVVPTVYRPAEYEPEPLGQLPKQLQGAKVLACISPSLINIPGGVTIRRQNLHTLWADLWLVNNNPYPVLFQAFRIDAEDVLYVPQGETVVAREGDPQGKGVLSLSKDFVVRREDATLALDAMEQWVAGRKYVHQFRWTAPAFVAADLSADFLMAGDILMRPIKIVDSWRGGGVRTVTVTAESSEN